MLKKNSTVIFFILLSAILFTIYNEYKTPDGVIPKSDSAETIAWLAFATSIVSLLTAIIGLIQKMMSNKND